jgi:RNA polymerase sigma-70 factor, ECF subfamily
MTTTAAATTADTATVGATTASAPGRPHFDGRPDHGAAAARTEQLYAQHGRLVSGLCRALLRDRGEAEDAAQQTFLSAHRALLNGSEPAEPAAWLATIARNECWARIKARMRQPLPSAQLEEERSSSDPVAEAIRNADLAALWSAIAALPKQQRDALLLREFGGLSYGELAGALAVTGSAVESLLFRARHGIRARLEAAYAALTGASWLESLARLPGVLGGGMAPVAAKVAAVSVGAAVATGGYVAAPLVVRTPAGPVRPARSIPQRPGALPAVVRAAETRPVAAATTRSPRPARSEVSLDRRSHRRAADRGEPSKEGGAQAVERSGRQESGRKPEPTVTESGSGGRGSNDGSSGSPEGSGSGDSSSGSGGSGSGDSGSGGSGDSGSGSGSGDSGSDGGDDGGLATTAANPALTVTVPLVEPSSGDGG